MKTVTIEKTINNYHTGDIIYWSVNDANDAYESISGEISSEDFIDGEVEKVMTLNQIKESSGGSSSGGGSSSDSGSGSSSGGSSSDSGSGSSSGGSSSDSGSGSSSGGSSSDSGSGSSSEETTSSAKYHVQVNTRALTDETDYNNGYSGFKFFFDYNETSEHLIPVWVIYGIGAECNISDYNPSVVGDSSFNKYFTARFDGDNLYVKPKQINNNWFESGNGVLTGTFTIALDSYITDQDGWTSATFVVYQRSCEYVRSVCPYNYVSAAGQASFNMSGGESVWHTCKIIEATTVNNGVGGTNHDYTGLYFNYLDTSDSYDISFSFDSNIDGLFDVEYNNGKLHITSLRDNDTGQDISGYCYMEIGNCGVKSRLKIIQYASTKVYSFYAHPDTTIQCSTTDEMTVNVTLDNQGYNLFKIYDQTPKPYEDEDTTTLDYTIADFYMGGQKLNVLINEYTLLPGSTEITVIVHPSGGGTGRGTIAFKFKPYSDNPPAESIDYVRYFDGDNITLSFE